LLDSLLQEILVPTHFVSDSTDKSEQKSADF